MPSFSVTQSWLSEKDIEKLIKGEWELDCPRMALRRKSKKGNEIYNGSGYIKYDSDHKLNFKIYTKQQMQFKDIFSDFGTYVSGRLIPHEDYFRLTAYDYTGRKWVSKCLTPSKNANVDIKGIILFSDLDLVECSLQKSSYSKNELPWINFKFFENIEIPCNVATETEIKRKGKLSSSYISRDFAEFSFDDYIFELNSKNNVLDFTISKKSKPLPNNFESRSIEALWFIFARNLIWNTMEICRGKTIKRVLIRKSNNKNFKYSIFPPLTLSLENANYVWKLYCFYLKFIFKFKNPKKLHPLSALIRNTILSSTGAIDAHILSLVIAIEGILKKLYNKVGSISEKEKNDLDSAIEFIDTSEIDSRTQKRIIGAINSWYKPSAKTIISKLVKDGFVTKDEFRSWEKARNPLAHGEFLKYSELQEHVDIRSKLLTMFYKLIFNAIEYSGPYVDYGTEGWPIKEFCPNKNFKCNIVK